MVLYKFILPPIYEDLEKTHKGAFLHYALLICCLGFLSFGVLNIIREALNLGATQLGFAIICVLGAVLNKHKRFYLAAALLSFVVYLGIFNNLIAGDGFHDPGIAALPLLILLPGMLFGKKHLPAITTLAIGSVLAVFLLWEIDLLTLKDSPTMGRVLTLIILQVITGLMVWVVISIYQQTVHSLKKSELRYRDLVENLNDLVYRYELDPWRLVYISPSIEELTGHAAIDMYLDLNLGIEIIHPEDRWVVDVFRSGKMDTKEAFTIRWIKKDGEMIWTDHRITPIHDQYGNLTAVEGIARDITLQIAAEKQLREGAEWYQVFFEDSTAQNWQFTVDPPMPLSLAEKEQAQWIINNARVQSVNLSFARSQNTTIDKLIGTTLLELNGGVNTFNQELIKTYIQQGYKLSNYESRQTDQNGDPIWSLHNVSSITENDQLISIWGSTLDIGEQKTNEERLRESESRYRALFDHSADGISIHAGDRYLDVNNTWLEMFGYQKHQVIGRTPFDFSPDVQPDGSLSANKGWMLLHQGAEGEDLVFEWRHTRADGTDFDVEIFMTTIDLSGEEVLITFLRDLTERKRAEVAAQEERQRLARELHDAVSQTLFSASMIAQTLERTWEKDPVLVRENLGELQLLTTGALAEMRNLLLELRPGAFEHTSMPDLLQQLVDGFSGRTKTEIQLETVGTNPLPVETRFGFFRIAQEGLTNIIKHARATRVVVQYDSHHRGADLRIRDNGRGFESASTSPGRYGLQIMRERAKAAGAILDIISEIDKGTTIHLQWSPEEETQ